MQEQHGLAGRVRIVLSDPQTGKIVEERWVKNHIVFQGRLLLANLFAGKATSSISGLKIIIGLDHTAPKDGDLLDKIKEETGWESNMLVTARAEVQTQAEKTEENVSGEKITVDKAKVIVKATFEPVKGEQTHQPLTEAGIVLVQDDKETLYNRVVFPVINRSTHLNMTFSWEVFF